MSEQPVDVKTEVPVGGTIAKVKKGMKKFARIIDYLQVYHEDLAATIEALALQNSFVPRRGGGITFLVPSAAVVAEIRAKTESDDPEVATDMIQSLIIPMLLEEVGDWREDSDDIPNLLGRRIEVGSIGTDRVKLKNGSVVTKNLEFKPLARSGTSDRANMAVWNVSGMVAMDGPATGRKPGVAVKKRTPKSRNNAQDDATVRAFVKSVEKREMKAMGSKEAVVASVKLAVLCNYVSYLVRHQSELEFKEHLDYFGQVCDPLACGGIEAAFYLVFCCRDSPGQDGIRRIGLHDTSTLAKIIGDGTVNLFSNVDKPLDVLGDACKGRAVNIDLQNEIQRITQSIRARTVDDVVKLYEKYSVNTYAGTRFRMIPGLKLLVDEFKHICSLGWLTFRSSYGSRATAYGEFLSSLGRYGIPNVIINNPETQSFVLAVHRVYKQSPKEITREHTSYLSDFLGEADGAFRSDRNDFGLDAENMRYMDPSQEYANSEMALSSGTITEMRNYMAKHGGKLPEGWL